MDQTVTLLSYDFAGSNPALPTFYKKRFAGFKICFKFANRLPTILETKCGSSSVGRASAFQAECREFDPRLPLHALLAQMVEHTTFNRVVTGSTPV